jgi:hypothetical protein
VKFIQKNASELEYLVGLEQHLGCRALRLVYMEFGVPFGMPQFSVLVGRGTKVFAKDSCRAADGFDKRVSNSKDPASSLCSSNGIATDSPELVAAAMTCTEPRAHF